MSAQIIKRHEGFVSEKENIMGRPQISFNDDLRLCIRFIQSQEQDTLIVLDIDDSRRLIEFCQGRLARIHPYSTPKPDDNREVPF